jgi:hypothetical protein
MKKQAGSKLALDRETLISLSPSEMVEINGGTWTQIIRVTLRYCTVVTTVVSHPVVTCGQKGQ